MKTSGQASFSPAGQDTLFYNARVHTVAPSLGHASVLAVQNGALVYVGHSPSEGLALLSTQAKKVDLRGHTVVPGLIDSHLHFLLQGQRLCEMDIFHKSKEDVLRLVAAEATRQEPGQWILGRGWDNETWPNNNWPCKEDLDAVAPANPVALSRVDGHAVWVNSLALKAAGIGPDTENPQGGEILRTTTGDPLGIVAGTVIFRLWEVMPPLSREQIFHAYTLAQQELFAYGITSVGDAWQSMGDHARLKEAYEKGLLKVRIYGMLASVEAQDTPCSGNASGPVCGLFGERLSLRAFKALLDGSLGSRSAWLSRAYADRPGHSGNARHTDEELYALLLPPHRRGFQICLHAIGDAATAQAIRVLEKLREEAPNGGARGGAGKEGKGTIRHRIEHFQMASPQEVRRAVRQGILPAMQTVHALADKKMAELRLGPEQLANSYPWRAVLDCGGILANGSDSPMEVVNPFLGFYAAVARTPFASCADMPPEAVRLTRREALQSYTLWAAMAEQGETRKGSLEPGKLADFAVLDKDILTCPLEDIPSTKALLTVLAGEIVHQQGIFAEICF